MRNVVSSLSAIRPVLAQVRKNMITHSHALTHTRAQTVGTHAVTYAQTRKHIRTCTHARTRTRTHARTRTRTHTRMYTHARHSSPFKRSQCLIRCGDMIIIHISHAHCMHVRLPEHNQSYAPHYGHLLFIF